MQLPADLDVDWEDDEFGDEYYSDDGFDMNDLGHFYNQVQHKPYRASFITESQIESGIELCHHLAISIVKITFIIIFVAILMKLWF